MGKQPIVISAWGQGPASQVLLCCGYLLNSPTLSFLTSEMEVIKSFRAAVSIERGIERFACNHSA